MYGLVYKDLDAIAIDCDTGQALIFENQEKAFEAFLKMDTHYQSLIKVSEINWSYL